MGYIVLIIRPDILLSSGLINDYNSFAFNDYIMDLQVRSLLISPGYPQLISS